MTDRLMPNNQEAERIVLGSIIHEEKNLFLIQAVINPEDFYSEYHRTIYRAILRLKTGNAPVDLISLKNELQRMGALDSVGGAGYLVSLTDGMASAINTGYYAEMVREKSKLRQMIQQCGNTSEQCFADEDTADQIIEAHEAEIHRINSHRSGSTVSCTDAIYDTYEEIKRRYEDKRKVTGIASGIDALDFLTTGLQPGDLNILAGKTGMGKTALALNLISHSMLRDRKKVLIFSLEMSRQQLGMRIISSESGVRVYNIRTGYIASNDWPVVGKTAAAVSDCRMWVHDKSVTMAEIDAISRRIYDQYGLDLIAIDYLQLVNPGAKKHENRTQEVTAISRGLKRLATDLNIPVLAMSQVNQDGEVRESRAIEQDASVVMVIEMAKEDLKSMVRVPCSIHVNKNRNGALGKVDAYFEKEIVKFVEAK